MNSGAIIFITFPAAKDLGGIRACDLPRSDVTLGEAS